MPSSLQILCINDFHAELLEGEASPGCAKLLGAVRTFLHTHPDTLVVFGGDNYRGDPVSELTGGTAVTAMMQQMGVVASAVGNHEFDFGPDALSRWQEEGSYAFLAANLRGEQGRPISAVKPYVFAECAGFKVAFLGLATAEPLDTAARPPEVRSWEISDGVPAARYWVDYLRGGRDERGIPDAIIALTHYGLKSGADRTFEGAEMCDLCRSVPGIDGAFAAHWHQFLSARIHGVPVAQGGCRGQGYALLTLTFDDGRRLLSVEPSFVNLRSRVPALPADGQLQEIVDASCAAVMAQLGEVIGQADRDFPYRDPETNEVPVAGTALGDLAVRVMAEQTGCPIALFYSGWIISGLCAGPVTLYDLYRALRFNHIMVSMELTGQALKRNLELGLRTLRRDGASPLAVGGVLLTADMSRPLGQRLRSARLPDGTELAPEQLYRVAVDDGLAENSMGFDFSSGTRRVYYDRTVRDCIIDQLRRLGTIPPKQMYNITLV